MIWLILAAMCVVVSHLAYVGRRDAHPDLDIKPMPPVVDTAGHGFDEGRLTPPYDQDGGDA